MTLVDQVTKVTLVLFVERVVGNVGFIMIELFALEGNSYFFSLMTDNVELDWCVTIVYLKIVCLQVLFFQKTHWPYNRHSHMFCSHESWYLLFS